MFSYQRQLGLLFNQDEAATKEKKDRICTGALIGGGAVAVALISSSGSDSQDNVPRFAAQHQAARGVLNGINPTSVKHIVNTGAMFIALLMGAILPPSL
ncbi:MAG: K+-transporting ATPase c subunit [Saprospiraceae bacterium]|jgi:K+-transporting ATPase c subunit